MIYIVAVENRKSGGPELLHQLAYVLNAIGKQAQMVYVANAFPLRIVKANVIDEYGAYCSQTEFRLEVIDRPENMVVVPEILFEILEDIHCATKVAWWLSVDGYKDILKDKYSFTDDDLKDHSCLDYYRFREREDVFHLVQSYYAWDFLKTKIGIASERTDYLSDYINDVYLQTDPEDLQIEKKNMVIFNPKKGGWRLKKIIDGTRDEILWVPLENLTKEKMRLHMLIAKVYVDFGNHPGKDRIPREAAISGCCVITGMQGAAAYDKDVPIPSRYKIDDEQDVDVDLVRRTILDIFDHYEERSKDFEEYRNMIRSEKEAFVQDVMRLFR
ncbi:MAG: hypothetical protein K5853_07655 [Lachnospiraceae bacterium]|nr:hypothetical protein [Lachnospiraceae bacterium]